MRNDGNYSIRANQFVRRAIRLDPVYCNTINDKAFTIYDNENCAVKRKRKRKKIREVMNESEKNFPIPNSNFLLGLRKNDTFSRWYVASFFSFSFSRSQKPRLNQSTKVDLFVKAWSNWYGIRIKRANCNRIPFTFDSSILWEIFSFF